MKLYCITEWRAKCHHVRNGGLLTVPPQTTIIIPESNTTEYVFTTGTTVLPTKSNDIDSLDIPQNSSMEIVSNSFTAVNRSTAETTTSSFHGQRIWLKNHGEVTKLSFLLLLIICH